MTNNSQNFELAEINTYYVPSDDYFTFEGDLKVSNFISQFILSSHVLLNYDETLVSASENILTLFESDDDICSLYTGTYENCQIIPNNFDSCPDEVRCIHSCSFVCLPEVSQQKSFTGL